MNETPAKTPSRKSGRALRVALILSLMVNVLVIGTLAGGAWRMARLDPAAAGPDIRALWRALPDDARRALRQTAREQGLHGEHGDRAERRSREGRVNAELLAALRAEPFDPESFSEILRVDREGALSRLDLAHAALADQIARLSPEAREAMASRFESGLRERNRR